MKNILIIGWWSKVWKNLINKLADSKLYRYHITYSKKEKISNDSEYVLNLSSDDSISRFIAWVRNIIFDAVICLSATYTADVDDNIKNYEQCAISALNYRKLLKWLNISKNSKILFFTDGGTWHPKLGYYSYSISKDILKLIIPKLAIEMIDNIIIWIDMWPVLTAKQNINKKEFYQRSIVQVKSPINGLINLIIFLCNEENYYSTWCIIDFTGWAYILRNKNNAREQLI